MYGTGPTLLDSGLHRNDEGLERQSVARVTRLPTVYILANRKNGTLYVGVTSDIVRRIWEHKSDCVAGFTERYGVHRLVWYEQHETMESAIAREKALKEWRRRWKIEMIERSNPQWRDLYEDLL